MLAMGVQTTRAVRQPTSSFTTIASKLAPTGLWFELQLGAQPATLAVAQRQ